MLELKDYQRRSLDALDSYLRLAAEHGAKKAFVLQTDRPYRAVPQLPGLPYICLRIPTGGGKTLMACHALGIVTTEFLQAEYLGGTRGEIDVTEEGKVEVHFVDQIHRLGDDYQGNRRLKGAHTTQQQANVFFSSVTPESPCSAPPASRGRNVVRRSRATGRGVAR